MRMRKKAKLLRVVTYLIVTIGAVILLLPLLWMISTSFKEPLKVFELPIRWIPEPVHFDNYIRLFTDYHFDRYLGNTLLLCALNIVGNIISCSLVSYAFAFTKHRYKNKIFILVLSTMMLTGVVTFFPRFILFNYIGWYGTVLPLWVPAFLANAGSSAFYIFLMRQFFLTIPTELVDAARIDGCSDLSILRRIVLPMAKPAVMVIVIFDFMSVWNDFFSPLIYIIREEQRTVGVALYYLQNTYEGTSSIPITMAASVLLIIPCILIYFFGQSHVAKGIVFKGVEK